MRVVRTARVAGHGDVPEPVAKPGQIVIDVHACAVNFPDVLMIQDLYQFKPPLPFSPGGEVAGVVNAVGEGVDGSAPGDRVFSSTGHGGFAEKVAVAAGSAIAVPEGIDLVHRRASCTPTGPRTTRSSTERGSSRQRRCWCCAAGGVGLAAVELGGTGRDRHRRRIE